LLAEALAESQITTLGLSWNKIGDAGVEALFKACCQCAEQGQLINIVRDVFTRAQEAEIKEVYDQAKLMRAEQSIATMLGYLNERVGKASPLNPERQMTEVLMEMIAAQLPSSVQTATIKRALKEREEKTEQGTTAVTSTHLEPEPEVEPEAEPIQLQPPRERHGPGAPTPCES
jgi:hypothetical protein